MGIVEGWVTKLLIWHSLVASPKLSEEDVEDTVTFAAMLTLCLPLVVVLAAMVTVLADSLTAEIVSVGTFVVIFATYSIVSRITRRTYGRNASYIRDRKVSIEQDVEKGRSWGRNRLIGIYSCFFGALALIAALA